MKDIDLDFFPALTELSSIIARTTDPRMQIALRAVLRDTTGWHPRRIIQALEAV